MSKSTSLVPLALAALLAAGPRAQVVPELERQQQALPRAEDVTDLATLIGYVKAREHAVRTVSMDIHTEGVQPDGSRFSADGSLRVLGDTHIHMRTTIRFGEGMWAATETVRTPAGMQMRESDPVQGEVFLSMDAATMARIDSASRALGDDGGPLGGDDGRARSPLGSAMLEDLAERFELTVEGPRVVDGRRAWVVAGPIRGGRSEDLELLGLGADRVDVLVREGDGAVVRMTQLRSGQPLLDVRIEHLELDQPMEPDEFVLSVRSDRVVDVLDHPPARAQIERLFEEARAKGWSDPAGARRDG
ncbi:MAG: hypothetical protein IPM29_11480 [Planctomycetes bacterium]|nr:hypothetical protein [Planctomycetota bacterium]